MSAPPATPLPSPATTLRSGKDGLQRVPAKGRWTADTERIFLQALAGSCNVRTSARAAGFSFQSAHNRRRRDPAFARRWDEALSEGLHRLEAELLEAAQAKVAGLDYSGPIQAVSFDSAVQLLAFHTRRRFGRAWRPRPDQRPLTTDALAVTLREKIARIHRNAEWRDAHAALPDDPAAAI